MKRWHEETALMLLRWRAEIEKHRHRSLGYLCKGTKYSRVGPSVARRWDTSPGTGKLELRDDAIGRGGEQVTAGLREVVS